MEEEDKQQNYYAKISLRNKTPDEAEFIRATFDNNINIAYKLASKYYKTKYWDYDEALQIAQLGLWKACLIWNPEQYRLSTLAYNIINRDFMDYDKRQKRQPSILFNLEDTCVTEDLSLSDVLEDTTTDTVKMFEEYENVKQLNRDINTLLEEISEENKLPKSITKLVYLFYVESNISNDLNMRSLNFISKGNIKQIISELQEKLNDFLE